MLLAEKIIEYTRDGKSPGVSELIELKEIAKKEGVSQKDLENRIQLSRQESKNSLDNKTEPLTPQFDSFQRESFEEELFKRRSNENTDYNFESYSPENTFSSYSEVEKAEIKVENNEILEIDLGKIETESDNLNEEDPKGEKVEMVSSSKDDFELIESEEVHEDKLNIEDFVQSIKETEEESNNSEESLKAHKSDFLLEKEREWQILQGKKEKKYSPKKTKTSHSSKTKSNSNKDTEAQKAFNTALIAFLVSIVFGFIGIFVGMYAFQKQEKLSKIYTSKKLSNAKTLSIVAMVIGVLHFVSKIFLRRLFGFY